MQRAGQGWPGRHDQGKTPGAPGHAGDPETLMYPRERTGEVEISSKGLARMKSPLRGFSRDKWDDSAPIVHVSTLPRRPGHALWDSSKNAWITHGSKDALFGTHHLPQGCARPTQTQLQGTSPAFVSAFWGEGGNERLFGGD